MRLERWLVAIPIAACSPFALGDAPVGDSGTTVQVTGAEAGAAADADADVDAAVDACAVFDDDFETPPNGWTPLGDAKLEGGVALLVPAVNSRRGAIWRPLFPVRTALQVSFRFHIVATSP